VRNSGPKGAKYSEYFLPGAWHLSAFVFSLRVAFVLGLSSDTKLRQWENKARQNKVNRIY
jgi:hypothetical protein